MPESNMFLYIIGEIAVVLLAICIFLLFHLGKLRKLVSKLEEKIASLRVSIGKSRNETKAALKKLAAKERVPRKSFLDFLDDEIDGTREHHNSLNPDRDIVLDIASDAPMDRQSCSLRHAFLIAEKEARYAGDDDNSNWDVLQAKLQQIIQFYDSAKPAAEPVDLEPELETVDSAADSEEIESYKKRIANLERFKTLFFETEEKWSSAKKQAEEYYQQLAAFGKEVSAGEDFDELLQKYSTAFDDVGDLLASGATENASSGTELVESSGRREGVGKTIIANQEEMQRLRNMAVDQHKVINELKKKLYSSSSEEERQEVVEKLNEQLEQQQRFLKEAETCTQLIEDELTRATEENEQLRAQLKAKATDESASNEEFDNIESVVSDLTSESKEMLGAIASLEDENKKLKQQLESAGFDSESESGAVENTDLLKEKLSEMQQELLNLQTQHIELEERYLELKMQ